jgi:hypothetical protein
MAAPTVSEAFVILLAGTRTVEPTLAAGTVVSYRTVVWVWGCHSSQQALPVMTVHVTDCRSRSCGWDGEGWESLQGTGGCS